MHSEGMINQIFCIKLCASFQYLCLFECYSLAIAYFCSSAVREKMRDLAYCFYFILILEKTENIFMCNHLHMNGGDT